MKNNLISICIPYKDSPKYLDELFASIKCQTYSNYEIVVCDDNSTKENCQKLEEKLDKYFDNYQIVKGEGKGLYLSRWNALNAASGDIILTADADDKYLGEGFFEYLNIIFNVTECELVWFDAVLEPYVNNSYTYKPTEKDKPIDKEFLNIIYDELKKDSDCSNKQMFNSQLKKLNLEIRFTKDILQKNRKYEFIQIWDKAISSSLLSKLQPIACDNLTYREDAIYSIQILMATDVYYMSYHKGYYYKKNKDSLMRSYSHTYIQSQIFQAEYIIKNLFDEHPDYPYNYYYACNKRGLYYHLLHMYNTMSKKKFIKEVDDFIESDNFARFKATYVSSVDGKKDGVWLIVLNNLYRENIKKVIKNFRLYNWYHMIFLIKHSRFVPNFLKNLVRVYDPVTKKNIWKINRWDKPPLSSVNYYSCNKKI